MEILKVENMNVYYGAIHAIKGISFHVDQGEVVPLIGANGAGKSTTLLLVEPHAQMALSVADRAYVMETGKITLSGTGAELAASDEVKKAYLGG